MLDDFLESFGPFVLITLVVLALFLFVFWYEDRYPCIKYQAVWVREWTEIQTIQHSCGQNCNFTTVVPITHPAHWEQSCMIRGDKKNGDRRAEFAPIPSEPLER